MRWRSRLALAFVVALTFAAMASSPAFAAGTGSGDSVSISASVSASPSNAATPAPLAQGPFSVQVGPNQDPGQPGKLIVIMSVNLSPDVPLPARVRIPIPPGAMVTWAGEVLGGDVSADPQRTYTLHDGVGGAQYAEFTMTQSRRGQVDTVAGPLTVKGAAVSAQLSFVQSAPSTSTEFAVRIPANASNVKIDPAPSGSPETNSTGESLYYVGTQSLPIGTKLALSISYTQGAASTSKPLASSSSSLLMLLGILLVVLIAIIAFVARHGSSEEESEEDEDEDEDEFAEDEDDEFDDDEFAEDEDDDSLDDDESGDEDEEPDEDDETDGD
jgi:hypothetical protein